LKGDTHNTILLESQRDTFSFFIDGSFPPWKANGMLSSYKVDGMFIFKKLTVYFTSDTYSTILKVDGIRII
jgi:hypothetical protein